MFIDNLTNTWNYYAIYTRVKTDKGIVGFSRILIESRMKKYKFNAFP